MSAVPRSIDRLDRSASLPALSALGTSRDAWRQALADVAVVTITPFAGDRLERVDHEGLARNLAHLLDAGVRLLVAGGNTGEFAALSRDELVQTVATHVRAARGRARVIAGIGYRTERTVDVGRAAIEAGADALMVHHPIHPFASEAGILRYYEWIASGLPDMPLILYVRGPQLTDAAVRRLAGVASIVAVKMGQPDPARFAGFVATAPDLAWVCGVAELWAVPFRLAGAIGFTSGLANVAPRRSLDVLEALRAGDLGRAAELVERLRPFEELRARHADANNIAVIKGALDIIGLSGGDLRPPLSGLDARDRSDLVRILEEWELDP